jgi:hypothetical protein
MSDFELNQRICIKNIKYHTIYDAKIVKITKHYLFCQKDINTTPDTNDNFLYGNYYKQFLFGDLDDEYDDSIIKIHKTSTYKLYKH